MTQNEYQVPGRFERRPLRIEMVLPSLAIGGMEVMTQELARALAARGHRVGITCLYDEGELADDVRRSGVPVTLLRCPGVMPNFRPDASLREYFLRYAPDVVHTHNGVWAKAAVAARAARIPVVLNTMHGLVHNEGRVDDWLRWWAAQHTDLVVAVASPLKSYLTRKAYISAEQVVVVPNAIDTDRFAPGPRSGSIRNRYGLGSRALLVGCIARLDPVKNHALLLNAMALLKNSMPDVHLVLVGDGPMRQQLETLTEQMDLRDSVIFTGTLHDSAPIYRDIDVFALGSTTEGTSISILEALASGVPVVATAVGGNPDLLAGGACGKLVPANDAVAMADALQQVLRDPGTASRLATTGRARVVALFGHKAMVQMYEGLYRHTLEGKRDVLEGKIEAFQMCNNSRNT